MPNKKLACILLFILPPTIAKAQKHSALFAEAGGNGILGTINYDFRFKENINTGKFKDGLGVRIGIGLSPKYILDTTIAHHPVSAKGSTFLFLLGINTFTCLDYSRSSGSNIEFGANLLYAPKNSIADKKGDFKEMARIIPSLNVGYRFQSDDGGSGLVWRICYTPYFLDSKIRHWGGISIGYNFN